MNRLLQQVGHVRQHRQVAGPFDGGGHFALILQGIAGNPAGKDLALFVDELDQEIGVLVVDVFDAVALEAAVFFALLTDLRIAEKFYIVSGGHYFYFIDSKIWM